MTGLPFHGFQEAVLGRIGTVVGSYTITEPLNAGGMGAVYRAEHALLGRSAAVKVLRPDLCDDRELVARFFTEAKAASAIHHPGIVEVFDFGYTEAGDAYLVMELLDGESLAHRLASRKRLPELHSALIARGIAGALGAAHAKGIVHRDLKPDNIFLVPDPDVAFGERPKILDFGIAKLTDVVTGARSGHTRTGALIGTPQYMAPEQAQSATAVDHRADLYSLGCILYEMLVGEPPFVAEGAGEVIAMHLFATPTPASDRLVVMSPELEAIVMRLLAKEPSDRFASTSEVVDALGGIVGRLSTERAATRVPGMRSSPQIDVPTPRPESSSVDLLRAKQPPLIVTESTAVAPRKRSVMPVVAALVTLAIVAGGVAAVAMRRSDKEAVAPTPPAPPVAVGSAMTGSDAGSAIATVASTTPADAGVTEPAAPPDAQPTVQLPKQVRAPHQTSMTPTSTTQPKPKQDANHLNDGTLIAPTLDDPH